MAQQGAALQSYNNELVKSIEELQSRRAALNKQIEAEASEKQKLETEKKSLEDRLTTVDNSLKNKLNTKAEYDKVIAEAEQVRIIGKSLNISIKNILSCSRRMSRSWSPVSCC